MSRRIQSGETAYYVFSPNVDPTGTRRGAIQGCLATDGNMTNSQILFASIGLELVGIGFVGWMIWRGLRRSRIRLDTWANDNGYTLLKAERRSWRKGPYRWSSSGQAIFRITVLDEDDEERMGWVCCGTWWKGAAFSDYVDGVLDEP